MEYYLPSPSPFPLHPIIALVRVCIGWYPSRDVRTSSGGCKHHLRFPLNDNISTRFFKRSNVTSFFLRPHLIRAYSVCDSYFLYPAAVSKTHQSSHQSLNGIMPRSTLLTLEWAVIAIASTLLLHTLSEPVTVKDCSGKSYLKERQINRYIIRVDYEQHTAL